MDKYTGAGNINNISNINGKENTENKENKESKIETEIVDYKRIFNENPKDAEPDGQEHNIILQKEKENEKKEKRAKKEKRYIFTFLVQSLVCLIIIGSIIVTKYTSPKTFVSVSSALNGLYQNNITLSDLSRIIDDDILNNDTLAAFFNMGGK